jgi:hypothetical protein
MLSFVEKVHECVGNRVFLYCLLFGFLVNVGVFDTLIRQELYGSCFCFAGVYFDEELVVF